MKSFRTAIRYAGVLLLLMVVGIASSVLFIASESGDTGDAVMLSSLATGLVMFIIGRLFKPAK